MLYLCVRIQIVYDGEEAILYVLWSQVGQGLHHPHGMAKPDAFLAMVDSFCNREFLPQG